MSATIALRRTSGAASFDSHQWINFQLDVARHATHKLWLMLGEARSKCEHISGVPLRPDAAGKLYLVYLAKGVHATTAIEGNTLTEEQVQEQISHGLDVPRSQEYLRQEVQNVIDGCNDIAQKLQQEPDAPITPELICQFNALVLRGLPVEDHVVPGEFRTCSVGVMGYRGAPWEHCPELVARLCDWLNGPDFRSADEDVAFPLAVLRAVLAHLYIAWIHPFGDGNGRTARLIEFQILAQSGIPYPAAHLLSNHYNKTRSEYYRCLDMSSKVEDGAMKFIEYAVQGFVDGLREQIDYIRAQQWRITWESHVHNYFRRVDGHAGERRRKLLLDLPDQWTERQDILGLSPRVAKAYGKLSSRTLERDLAVLTAAQLLRNEGTRVRPNRHLILAFLPMCCPRPRPAARTNATGGQESES